MYIICSLPDSGVMIIFGHFVVKNLSKHMGETR